MPSRILVLEPDPMRQVAFRAALSSAGYVAAAVAAPDEAAELARRGEADLVLLGPELDVGAMSAAELEQPVVKLAILPDCVIGEAVPGGSQKLPPDLPAILEALTRYMRFAPLRTAGSLAEEENLLANWAEFEGKPG